MSDMQAQPVAAAPSQTAALTQMQRVTNIFAAPSKTFNDIRDHSRSWWMPFIILSVVGYLFFAVIYTKVGMQQVVDNQTHLSPKAEERLAQATPEQREFSNKLSVGITEGVFIGGPILVLIITAVGSLVLWGTINFGFGGKAKYGAVFSIWMFASLPGIVKPILGSIVIFTGMAPESFNIKNYAPTNIAALLMNPLETNAALYSLATSIDIVTIWTLVLAGIGTATVAGTKRSAGYIAVFGWWAIITLVSAGAAAAFN
jgi:hypothetical protein